MHLDMAIPPIFHYTGHKFKRLPEMFEKLPKDINCIFEPFCGSGVVSINALQHGIAEKAILNDFDSNVTGLLFYMLSTSTFEDEANLCNTLYPDDEAGYLQLKEDYNVARKTKCGGKIYPMLFCLIARSFNNQMRFSKKSGFNLPYGKRNNFNLEPQRAARDLYKNKLIGIMCQDYKNSVDSIIPETDFVFVDPPYSDTSAKYNTKWSKNNDMELYEWLDKLSDSGVRWMLTSTLRNRGNHNDGLDKFINDRNLEVSQLNGSYSNSSYFKSDQETVELMVMNYHN